MPRYTYENPETGEEETVTMTYEEMMAYEKANPTIQRVFKATPQVDQWNTVRRPRGSSNFRDRLKQIKAGSGSKNVIEV